MCACRAPPPDLVVPSVAEGGAAQLAVGLPERLRSCLGAGQQPGHTLQFIAAVLYAPVCGLSVPSPNCRLSCPPQRQLWSVWGLPACGCLLTKPSRSCWCWPSRVCVLRLWVSSYCMPCWSSCGACGLLGLHSLIDRKLACMLCIRHLVCQEPPCHACLESPPASPFPSAPRL